MMINNVMVLLRKTGLVACIFAAGSCLDAQEATNNYGLSDDPGIKVDYTAAVGLLEKEWSGMRVKSIEILHIPTNRVYAMMVSSSQLEYRYGYRLVVRDPESSDLFRGLIGILATLPVISSEVRPDVRWGIVFRNLNDQPVFAVYFDRTGRRGVVNSACVSINSDALKAWAERTFSRVFR